jgi:hypothetical protein
LGNFEGFEGAVSTFHANGEIYSFTRGVVRVEEQALVLRSLGRYTGANYHNKLTSEPNFTSQEGELVFQFSELSEIEVPDSIVARKGLEVAGRGKLYLF